MANLLNNYRYSINTNSAGEALSVNYLNGNVGIGKTAPTEKLEISGNVFLNGNSPKLRFNESGIAAFNTGIFGTTISNSRYSISSLATNSEVFSVNYLNGNVGIGTTNPTVKLEVNSTVNEVAIFKGTAGIAQFALSNDANKGINIYTYKSDYPAGTGSMFSVGANGSGITQTGNAPLAIGTYGVAQPLILGTNSSEKMRIFADGNVGIGTTDGKAINWQLRER